MESYLSKFSINDIIKIESQDLQFLALQKVRKKINSNTKNKKEKIINQNLFLFLILQNWLISYQIAWSWENRREEFSQKINKDRKTISKNLIQQKNNIDWRYWFLTTSQYNKRIYNIKKSRLIRFNKFLETINWEDQDLFLNHYQDMNWLLNKISQIMERPSDSKTLTFTIKMFGYWARIIFNKIIYYPGCINIPIDSRLKKIYEINTNQKLSNNIKDKKMIAKYFAELSNKYQIPPLHLDSILRIDYRKKHIKNKLLLN